LLAGAPRLALPDSAYSAEASLRPSVCGTGRHLWTHADFRGTGRAVRAAAPTLECPRFFAVAALVSLVRRSTWGPMSTLFYRRGRIPYGGWLTPCALRLREPHQTARPLTSRVAASVLGRSAPRSPSRRLLACACSRCCRCGLGSLGPRWFRAEASWSGASSIGSMLDLRRVERRARSLR